MALQSHKFVSSWEEYFVMFQNSSQNISIEQKVVMMTHINVEAVGMKHFLCLNCAATTEGCSIRYICTLRRLYPM
jgi:hypothetical protein